MTTTTEEIITPSSGNVFEDLGLPDAEEMLVKAQLAHEIATIIKTRRWTQAKTAERLEMSQPKLSDMLRGKYRGISVQKMTSYLNLLGQEIEIVVRKVANPRTNGHTKVVVIEPEFECA